MNTQPGRLLTEQEIRTFRAAWPREGRMSVSHGNVAACGCAWTLEEITYCNEHGAAPEEGG